MISAGLVAFVDLFYIVFNVLLFARILASWAVPDLRANWFTGVLYDLTEPVLGPVRALLPRSLLFDLSPLATFFLLQFVQWAVHTLAAGS